MKQESTKTLGPDGRLRGVSRLLARIIGGGGHFGSKVLLDSALRARFLKPDLLKTLTHKNQKYRGSLLNFWWDFVHGVYCQTDLGRTIHRFLG